MKLALLIAAGLPLAAQVFNLGSAADPCTGGNAFTLLPTTPPAAMPTNRYDPVGFTCVFQGAAGGQLTYSVQVDWIEANVSAPNLRLFDMSIQGAPVLSSFDIFAAGGTDPSKIVTRYYNVFTVDGNITFRLHTVFRSAVLYRVTLSTPKLSRQMGDDKFQISCNTTAAQNLNTNCNNTVTPVVPATTFTLSHAPQSAACLTVLRNGIKIYQENSAWSLAGNILTVPTTADGDMIEAVYSYQP